MSYTAGAMQPHQKLTRVELIELVKTLEAATTVVAHSTAERAEEARTALGDSEERLRAILETAVEGIITIDERGLIESLNPAAEKMFGYPARELIGRNVSVLMPTPYRQQHDGYIKNYRETGRAHIIGIGREVVGQRKDGSVFPMDLSVSEVKLAERRIFTGFVREITERKHLEQEILEISGREQRRIGQDLHDGLCQQLAGIELLAQVLEQKLTPKSPAEARRAAEIAGHVREAIGHTRRLARGLSPVELESDGLMSALGELALNIEKLFGIQCRFECAERFPVRNNAVATHLYRIAQEAINNAIRHGRARLVEIRLGRTEGRPCLVVTDDGSGFVEPDPKYDGMGLRIMRHRASVIGGRLEIRRCKPRGTEVRCCFDQDS